MSQWRTYLVDGDEFLLGLYFTFELFFQLSLVVMRLERNIDS